MKKLSHYQEGDKLEGQIITCVYGASDDFIVYEQNTNYKIAYYTSDNIDGIELLNPIKPLLIDIFGLIESKGLRKKYCRRVASAYISCLDGHPDTAKTMLEKILSAVENYEHLKSKLFYQLSCLIPVVLNLLITYLVTYNYISNLPPSIVMLITIATFGSIGGFISVSLNINKLDLDIYGGTKTQIASGLIRIFIAMVSSLVIFVLIKSNLVLGIINDTNNIFMYYTLAVVSGFSINFVPNIIRDIVKEKSPNQ